MEKHYEELAKYFSQSEQTNEQYCNMWETENYMAVNAQPAQVCVSQGTKMSDPYVITVTNTNTLVGGTSTYTLFGANLYLYDGTGKYGAGTGVSVATDDANFPYQALLAQTMNDKFNTHIWRIDSTEAVSLTKAIKIWFINGNGSGAWKRIPMASKRNLYATAGLYAVEFEYDVKIDGNTYFTGTIVNGATLTFTLYPSNVIDTAQSFINPNGQINKTYISGLPSFQPVAQVATQNGLIMAGQGKG